MERANLPKQECVGPWCPYYSNLVFVDRDKGIHMKNAMPAEWFAGMEAAKAAGRRDAAQLLSHR